MGAIGLPTEDTMRDFIHRAFKFADHYRGTVAGVGILAGLVGFTGCSNIDARVPSTQTGKIVNADQREQEYVAEIRAIRAGLAEHQAAIEVAGRKIDSLIQTAEQLDEDFDFDLRRITEEIEARNRIIASTVGVVQAAVPVAGPWIELLLPALGLGGVAVAGGVTVDNRRKDKVIAKAKADREAAK
jgi:hypothetical protein